MEENLSEANLGKMKFAIVAAAGLVFALIVGLVNYLAGVNSVLNVAIVLCVFIVMGCTIAFLLQERNEQEAIKEVEVKNSIDELTPTINKIVSLLDDVDARVKQCSELVETSGKRLSDSTRSQLNVVIQIRDKLGERASTVRTMVDSRDDEKIREATEIINMPLTFPVDPINSLMLSTLRLPDLPSDQWEPTLFTILEKVQKEAELLA